MSEILFSGLLKSYLHYKRKYTFSDPWTVITPSALCILYACIT